MALRWTKLLYGTGVETIDAQHRRLFALMNGLIAASERADSAAMNETLARLESYAKRHFRCEEKTMAKGRCPALCLNQAEHREFGNRLALLKKEFEMNGLSVEFAQDLKFFILGWVRTHIQAVDVHLQCTVSHGFRLSDPPPDGAGP